MTTLENTTPVIIQKTSSPLWVQPNSSLLTLVTIDTLVTLICSCVITAVVMWLLNRRSQRKEQRDKLSNIIQVSVWNYTFPYTLL